jgi:hypothetical protein
LFFDFTPFYGHISQGEERQDFLLTFIPYTDGGQDFTRADYLVNKRKELAAVPSLPEDSLGLYR